MPPLRPEGQTVFICNEHMRKVPADFILRRISSYENDSFQCQSMGFT